MNKPALTVGFARILLVDDDEEVRAAMRRALAQAGFAVTEARSGDAAAALIGEAAPWSLLVTDVRLPGALDGVALAASWRKTAPGRPLLFVSGYSDDLLGPGSLGAYEELLNKPFRRACLVDAVQRLLVRARHPSRPVMDPSPAWAAASAAAPLVSAPTARLSARIASH